MHSECSCPAMGSDRLYKEIAKKLKVDSFVFVIVCRECRSRPLSTSIIRQMFMLLVQLVLCVCVCVVDVEVENLMPSVFIWNFISCCNVSL
jgi:hypothetical protein